MDSKNLHELAPCGVSFVKKKNSLGNFFNLG